MQNIIIGTAGHIDHGKTTLIKALTGKETDRLKEEKERGISIDLGFTYFDLPSGRRAGIVDVPGHEKFIKNMLAGVGGIDIVLLVIAADEGVMPQTQEHLNILNLLEVKKGIIVLSKCDMVEEEWLQMVEEDVREAVSNTFIENAPIIRVSSIKNIGIQELIEKIDKLTLQVEKKDNTKPFRLPIDRVFTIKGFGTVITGTLIEGSIKEGDMAMLYPSEQEVKVRTLQVHDENVKQAYAGQRVAVNLSNIKKEQISRGDVLACKNSLQPTMMLDCKIQLLKESPFSIRNRERVRIYIGTSEILGRVVLLDREELLPGQEGYVQLRLETNSVAKPMDHLIIRFYSPMVTIGGGVVLDAYPQKRKRFKDEVIQQLQLREKGDTKKVLLQFLKEYSNQYLSLNEIQKRTGISYQELEKNYENLQEENRIIVLSISDKKYLFHMNYIKDIDEKLQAYLNKFHQTYPLKKGASKEEIRNKILNAAPGKIAEQLLKFLEKKGKISIHQETISLRGFTVELSREQKQIANVIEKSFKQGKFNPPNKKVWLNNQENSKEYEQVFEAFIDWGILVKITEEIYFHKDSYELAKRKLQNYFQEHKEIDVATFRDLLGTSRKYAIALLEYFDQKKFTKRIRDIRVLNE
ncbi:selenocysteine-specific translation elongation factor [Garciella nitratireducens]|uniref:Selenocysteine-specific elongation factor n=1 Tax=Garciella nitratireducens DSM 15102 TaxID=1121911 RepID=A0A1T4KT90_9FIRM|nr:selenocysteine-specific translation elongation factor [Garciella nitratireducens]SJZ45664.1 selenocysteine-specific translation elongation factor SelB [Garciella nitratireducens DSM 15102]